VAGYVIAILGHYRIVFGRNREGPRYNPEPAEKVAVIAFSIAAVVVFIARVAQAHG
jgi:hypothetical protein